MIKNASISECGRYRYFLSRIWDENKSKIMFLMLNPSTADEFVDDPTIRRCINFAIDWNYGGIYVCNLFAYRATNPNDLLATIDPIGVNNHNFLIEKSKDVKIIICAYGNEKIIKKFSGYVNSTLNNLDYEKLFYLELSINKIPKHPLYLKKSLTPKKYERDNK